MRVRINAVEEVTGPIDYAYSIEVDLNDGEKPFQCRLRDEDAGRLLRQLNRATDRRMCETGWWAMLNAIVTNEGKPEDLVEHEFMCKKDAPEAWA